MKLLLLLFLSQPAACLRLARGLPRRSFGCAALVAALPAALPANALVKGSAPPPRQSKGATERKCRDIDECEALGAQRASASFDTSDASRSFSTTTRGVRYRDVRLGEGAVSSRGDTVVIKYRVMRLGKRSSDNLSGEASPVFSLGYGEDDDSETDVLKAKLGSGALIEALDDAIVGMSPGGKRRLFVVPEKGWKKINSSCSAESNGASNSGEASAGIADLVGQAVVPLAQIVDNSACIELDRLPQPRNYGATRRLARRFDEGLLLEVELREVTPAK